MGKNYISNNINNIGFKKNIETKELYKKSLNNNEKSKLDYHKMEKIFNSNIDSKSGKNNEINLVKEINLGETAYSLCYLKNHKLIALGMNKKIRFYDYSNFSFKMEGNLFDERIAYILS